MTTVPLFTRQSDRRGLPDIFAVAAMLACGLVPTTAAGISPVTGSHRLATPQSSSLVSKPAVSSSSTSAPSSTKKSKRHHSRFHRTPKQKAPTPDRIREIQTALARDGYFDGEPNGKWDARTAQSMQRFQQDHGLPPTGKLDALSLQKLGLGSGIAGLGAPQPEEPPDSSAETSKPPRF